MMGFRVVELEPSLTVFQILVLEFAKQKQTSLVNKEFFTLHVSLQGKVYLLLT